MAQKSDREKGEGRGIRVRGRGTHVYAAEERKSERVSRPIGICGNNDS